MAKTHRESLGESLGFCSSFLFHVFVRQFSSSVFFVVFSLLILVFFATVIVTLFVLVVVIALS